MSEVLDRSQIEEGVGILQLDSPWEVRVHEVLLTKEEKVLGVCFDQIFELESGDVNRLLLYSISIKVHLVME